MALNKLSENLDQVSEHELGFEFDEAVVWSRLEQRLDNRRTYTFWWVVAACLLAAFLFTPYTLLEKTTSNNHIVSDDIQVKNELPIKGKMPIVEQSNTPTQQAKFEEFKMLERREATSLQVAKLTSPKLSLEPIPILKQERKNKPVFAAKDISIIQASLERSSIEKGKNVTVRAQLHASTQPIQFNNQVFKIKLLEGSNN